MCYKLDFRLTSIKSLIFNGLIGFFGGLVMIFDGVKSGEMVDFVGVCRSGYRSESGEKCVGSGVCEKMYVTWGWNT